MTDLRLLNSASVKDAYLLTKISENLQKLKDATICMSIDACDAYHCVQIEEGSRDCTAFISHSEPFATYVCHLAYPMQAVCIPGCWTGPWLVHSTDPWGHLEHLKKVVQAHSQAGIKIQPKKTKIF